MVRRVPIIQQDILTYFDNDTCTSLVVGTPAWYEWLSHFSTFSFQNVQGNFTARKERFQRGGWYWKAYRKCENKLSSAYLGKSENLTLERLMSVAQKLSSPSAKSSSHKEELEQRAYEIVLENRLLATKLSIPFIRSPLIQRLRLHERLQQGMKRPLTLVSAPAGSGKTTLLSQWAHQYPDPVAWVSLDRHDNDPIRFWTVLLTAIEAIHPGPGEFIWPQLPFTYPSSTDSLVTNLLSALATLSQDTILILDDYHFIEAQQIHDLLSLLLTHMPISVHLVLACRVDPPLPLARWRANNNLTEIRSTDLSFTHTETIAFFADIMNVPLSAADVVTIAARTEGWIAGLQLAALSLQGGQSRADGTTPFTGEDRYVVDYLLEEVFKCQDATIQDFLLKTSILDSLTAPLCDEVTGQSSSQAMLETLERRNLFLIPLDNKRSWYRYHYLFADFLHRLLLQRNSDSFSMLRYRASRWYEHHGFITEAVEQALANSDWDRVMQLAEFISERMIAQGQHATLQRWLEALPVEATRTHPRLSIDYIWTLIHTGRNEACEFPLQAVELACRAEGNQQKLGEIFAIRASLAWSERHINLALSFARQALEAISEHNTHQQVIINTIQAGTYVIAGDILKAQEYNTKACSLSETISDSIGLIQSIRSRGDIEMLKGELHTAAEYYHAGIQLASDPSLCWLETDLHLKIGNIYRERNKLDLAHSHIQQGLMLCQQDSARRCYASASVAYAQLLFSQGELAAIHPILEDAKKKVPQIGRKVLLRRAEMYAMRVLLRQGNFTEVAQWVESYPLPTDAYLVYEHRIEYLMLARAFIALRKPENALHLLRSLLHLAEKGGCRGDTVEMLMLKALAHYARGEREHALVILEETLLFAEAKGYVRVFLDEGEPMLALLRYAAEHGMMSNYIHTLLALSEGASQTDIFSTKWSIGYQSLTVREQEVLRLIAEGASNQEIAQQLVIALNTAKKHVSNIYNKLGVTSRIQALACTKTLHFLKT